MKLSIVISAYNEAATINEILRRVLATPYEKEVIVVDDGSTDGTRDILAAQTDPRIRVILHDRNQGKGGGLRTGFAHATGDFVIVQDADLEYDPREYAVLLAPLLEGDADVVYGSRFVGSPRRVLLFWHMIGNQALTLLSNMTTNLNLTDMETGYKAFKIDVVRRIAIESNRFGVEPELTAKIARLGCRVYEVPISYRGRTYAEGKKIKWTDGVEAIKSILKYGLLPNQSSTHVGYDVLSTMDSMHNYNEWLWEQVSPHVGQRVFEAGSGTGTMTKFLVGKERVVGSDFDRHYVSMLQGQYADRPNMRIEWADLAGPDWPDVSDEHIDSIVCMNVLEHLPDDRYILRKFFDLLEPGGRVVLLIPADNRLYGTMDRALGHYRRYSSEPMSNMLRATGFKVESVRHLNPTGPIGWFVNGRLLRRRIVPAGQAALYDKLFPVLKLAEDLHLPFGLSLLAVGRKPG